FLFTPLPPSALYTLSLHDALPICSRSAPAISRASGASCWKSYEQGAGGREQSREMEVARAAIPTGVVARAGLGGSRDAGPDRVEDRKSTRLNSSHLGISYAVFCLK